MKKYKIKLVEKVIHYETQINVKIVISATSV